jgi:hypothetical protein
MSLENVTVVRTSEDGLREAQWHFYRLYTDLVVNAYEELARPSLRHKFKVVRRWGRLTNRRENSISQGDVPLPADIKAEAIEKYVAEMKAQLTVKFQD